jgi:hypothetical protein
VKSMVRTCYTNPAELAALQWPLAGPAGFLARQVCTMAAKSHSFNAMAQLFLTNCRQDSSTCSSGPGKVCRSSQWCDWACLQVFGLAVCCSVGYLETSYSLT